MLETLLLRAGHPPRPIAQSNVAAVFESVGAIRWAHKTEGGKTVWMHYAEWDESIEYAALNSLASTWAHRAIYGPAVFSARTPLPQLVCKMSGLNNSLIYF